MMRSLLAGSLLVVCALAQSPPAFEVASIKINRSDSGISGSDTINGKFVGNNLSLNRYIRMAYGVSDFQVRGPQWIDQDSFDINAIPPASARPPDLMLMLRSLLAERFQLQVHTETKVISAYSLGIAKSGLKIKETEDVGDSTTNNERGALFVHKSSMKRFAEVLSRQTDRPVIDQTGRAGVFDFTLNWSDDDSGPSLFTAIQEQLGLKLTAAKIPLEIVVVDKALRVPTEN